MFNHEKDITNTIKEISKTLKRIEKVLRRNKMISENAEENEMHYRCNICKNDFEEHEGKIINNKFLCENCIRIIIRKHVAEIYNISMEKLNQKISKCSRNISKDK